MSSETQDKIVKNILLLISRKSLSEIERKIKNARSSDETSRGEYQKILVEIAQVRSLINRIISQIDRESK